jgi:hypothetical protein
VRFFDYWGAFRCCDAAEIISVEVAELAIEPLDSV